MLKQQDQDFSKSLGKVEVIESAIENYELAYRMQSLVPDVVDLSKETKATRQLYGIDSKDEHKRRYGMECLRARRLVSGVGIRRRRSLGNANIGVLPLADRRQAPIADASNDLVRFREGALPDFLPERRSRPTSPGPQDSLDSNEFV